MLSEPSCAKNETRWSDPRAGAEEAVNVVQDPADRTLSAHRKHERTKSFGNCWRQEQGLPWHSYSGGKCRPSFAQAVDEVLVESSPRCLFNQTVGVSRLPADGIAAAPACACRALCGLHALINVEMCRDVITAFAIPQFRHAVASAWLLASLLHHTSGIAAVLAGRRHRLARLHEVPAQEP